MSQIFKEQNQMLIRFPQNIADILNEYFENGGEEPEITIQTNNSPQKQQVPRIALKVGVNGQEYKASVVQLPTISSTFKTIDRVNFFKSNDISEMVLVHQSQYDQIGQSQAQRKMTTIGGEQKIYKYLGESGVTDATTNVRQRFFRKKPKIDQEIVTQVDQALDQIKSQFTKQDDKGDKKPRRKPE